MPTLDPARASLAGLLLLMAAAGSARAQEGAAEPLTIDSVVIEPQNVFAETAASRNWLYRTANSLRFRTNVGVVRRELLFAPGEKFDAEKLAETERNLRTLNIFRTVDVDTVREDGRLLAIVRTQDAWSTLPIFSGRFASDGTLTGRIGLTERNVAGTGNFLSLAYRKDTDRDGGDFGGLWRRVAGSQVDVAASLDLLSDGNAAGWTVGDPWRSLQDRFFLRLGGVTADRRRLQYVTLSATRRDTIRYRQHLFAQQVSVGFAPVASSRRVVRIGATASLRNERYLLSTAEGPLTVPDSVKGDVGLFASFEQPRYRVVGYVDGLNKQDIDLTTGIAVSLRLAPSAFGYERTGVGPAVSIRGGATKGALLVRAAIAANGLFNSAGLDSGRVVASVTGGAITGSRHATLLHVQGGVMEGQAPGREFDLGFSAPPRSFEPHAFVGTRALWGTFEHRWYVLPRILDQFGAALAGYTDFGGAWYEGQTPRWGAEVGVGIRTSSRLAPGAESSRIDVGYRLGSGFEGSRIVLSVGTGFVFF